MIIVFCVLIFFLKGCPFTTFEEIVLPIDYDVKKITKKVHLDSEELSFSIGFWTLSQERVEIDHGQPKGEFLRIYENNTTRMFGQESISYSSNFNYFLYPTDNTHWKVIIFPMHFWDRLDNWLFTLITFSNNFNTIIIEMLGKKFELNLKVLEQDHSYEFVIFCPKCPLERSFIGRMSQLIFFENYIYQNTSFKYFQEYCKIPNLGIGLQRANIVLGLIDFSSRETLTVSFQEYGRKYCIQGWVKFPNSQIISTQQILIRLSQNVQQPILKLPGDYLFKLEYFISSVNQSASKIAITVDSCRADGINCKDRQIIDYTYNSIFTSFNQEFKNSQNDQFYHGITNWHYFQYEYGRRNDPQQNVTFGMLFQMKFFNSIGLISQKIPESLKSSYINGIFYVYVGECDQGIDQLLATIYDLNIIYNYQQDQELLLSCHQSCLTCDGPLNSNCLSCYDNFTYNQIFKQCNCEIGYVEAEANQCIKQQGYFPFLTFLQELDEIHNFCQQGHYIIPKSERNFTCFQCPQSNKKDILCADCWMNQNSWYLNPICTSDFILEQEIYILTNRKVQEYDFYIINDDFNLFYMQGFQGFCLSGSDCHSINNILHLRQQVQVTCKLNFVFSNNGCYQFDYYCLEYDRKGQCQNCAESYYLIGQVCKQCPQNCKHCKQDSNKQKVICLQCIHNHGFYQNQCFKCGLFCQMCQEKKVPYSDQTLLVCLKCIDVSDYFISFDQINCQKNEIKDCKYVVQYSNVELVDLTYFKFNLNESGIFTICAVCKNNKQYQFEQKICEVGEQFRIGCNILVEKDGKPICSEFVSVECQIQNCDLCIQMDKNQLFFCLKCGTGYYADRLFRFCQVCPPQLNCKICAQQQKQSQDEWVWQIRPFLKQFMEIATKQQFENIQSQKAEDYEIICKQCNDGYVLINGLCIFQNLQKSCEKFQLVQNNLKCTSCKKSEINQIPTLFNNQCIYCPENCSVCKPRSLEEINIINSQFNDEKYISYSYQCLKGRSDQFYYDSLLSQFIDCNSIEQCKNQITLKMNLICSSTDYKFQLNQHVSKFEQMQFKQENILLEDLFSETSFQQYENDLFYKLANKNFVKEIYIIVQNKIEQNCTLEKQAAITQTFKEHIFSLQNVNLKFDFETNVQIHYSENITFRNFQYLEFNNIDFFPKMTGLQKRIIFTSLQYQSIFLQNISITQSQLIQNDIQISIEKVFQLQIDNFTVSNILLKDQIFFIYIKQQDQQQQLQLKSMKLMNCFFLNTTVFQFNLKTLDVLTIDNFIVKSIFNRSSIINTDQSYSFRNTTSLSEFIGTATFNGFYISSEIKNIDGLFAVEIFDRVDYSNFTIINSSINNSTIINFYSQTSISNLRITNSTMYASSIIILNKNSSKLLMKLQIAFLCFENNEYDSSIHFIFIQKLFTSEQQLQIDNLSLIDNYGRFNEEIEKTYENSLVYLEASYIFISNLLLQKGSGMTELFVKGATNFTLVNTIIKQDDKFHFKCLHQKYECFNFQVIKYWFESAISIYSTKQVFVQNLKIFDVQIFDFPILSYNSADEKILEELEVFIFQDIEIHNNLLVQTNILSTFSILYINSQQKTNLFFNKCKFSNNTLHSYIKNYQKISSLLVAIDCSKCNFVLNNSLITKNFMTNSSDSIIFINAQQIQIENCQFQLNSIFNYDLISQHLFWDVFYEQIFLEQLALIYPISSETGNGFLKGEIIQIYNTNISFSQGQAGGAFKFTGVNNCKIRLHAIVLNEIKTLFSGSLEQGGALNIDGSQTQTLSLEISQMNAENIFSQNEGGFIYLKLQNQETRIIIKQIKMKDIYSELGSVAFIEYQQQSLKEQSFWLSDMTLQNSKQGFISFLNKYRVLSEYDKIKLIYNRTLFYVNQGNEFTFTHVYLYNLNEGLFSMYGIQKLILYNIEVQNSAFQVHLIKVTPQQYIQNYIEIKQIILFNISQSIIQYDLNCFSNPNLYPVIQSECNSLSKTPKLVEEFYSAKSHFHKIQNCSNISLLNNSLFQSEGLIIFNGLSEFSKIIISNTHINKIDCKGCTTGLFVCQYQAQNNIQLQNSVIYQLSILNSNCGQTCCLNLEKIIQSEHRLIQNQQWQIQNNEVNLNQYFCQNNTATLGVCLQVQNFRAIMQNSVLLDNKALTFGGAVYIKSTSLFLMNNCIIKTNQAQVGGGIYFEDMPYMNYLQLKNSVQENQAKIQGNNYKVMPEYLDLYLQTHIRLEQQIINFNDTVKIIQVAKADESEIFLPSGQAISSYQFFDQNKRIYNYPDYIFRLQAMQFDNSQSKNLDNSYCIIRSRKINQSMVVEDQEFTNNYTDIENIAFDLGTQQYNLDNLTLFFDPDQPTEIKLQLEFQCNSIIVLEYEKKFPFILKHFHNNYKLRLNVKTLPCQYGEIKIQESQACMVCDYKNGFFSLTLNEPKCQIKDDESTISVKSALLELKKEYWRPYFDTNQVSFCYNKPENCLGGWLEGDISCKIGNIGALCEQCDIFNVRGDGNFAIIDNYECGLCSSQARNFILLIFATLWTLMNLFISVQSNQKVQDEEAMLQVFYSYHYWKFLTKSQTGALMKMLTTYLQIISSLTTFQLNFYRGITNFLNVLGNPIEITANSQDCLLINHFHSGIQYIRAVWFILMPFYYLIVNLLAFFFGSLLKVNSYNVSIISTSILHIYIYFQPNMMGNLMSLLSYTEISGYKWVKANVAVRYDNNLHFQWMIEFAFPLFLLFGFVIPLFLLQRLVQSRKVQHKKEFRKIWGYLYHQYNQQNHYWEIVKIFQKQLIIIFLSFFEEQIALKGMFIVLIQFIYSQLVLKKQPYQIKQQNDLDFSASNVCIISICLAIGIQLSQQQNYMEVQVPFWIILGYFNLKFLFLILSKIFLEYTKNFPSMLKANQIRIAFPFLKKINFIDRYLDRKQKQKEKIKLLYKKLKQIIFPLAKKSVKQQNYYFKNMRKSDEIKECSSIMQAQIMGGKLFILTSKNQGEI